MSKGSTKPGDETDTGSGTGTGAETGASAPAATIEPNQAAIRASTTAPEAARTEPSIPALLERVNDLESQLAALVDDLAVAIPELRSPAPVPTIAASPSGAYALQPATPALESLRERAATGDRAALLRYLRLRRS